jgi:tetratricopeptide (TPR) repeat protein
MEGRTPAAAKMTNADSIKNAGELRDRLSQAELALAGLNRGGAENALALVRLVAGIEEAISRLEQQFSIELKPERARLQILEQRLRNNAALVVQRAGAGRLQRLRQEQQPPDGEWWWRLDLIVAEERRVSTRRLGIRVGIGVAVLVVLAVVYQLFLAPSPANMSAADHVSAAETDLTQGNLEGALTEYQAALKLQPNDAASEAGAAAILDQLGRTTEAQPYFEKAQADAASEADYYANLALAYYRMSSQGTIDATAKAEDAANKAIAADPNSAMAYYALGSVYELQGKVAEAIDALNKAAGLTDNAALTAAIKMRVAMLSQRPAGLPTMSTEATQSGS